MMSLRERCIKLREIAEYLEDDERTQHIVPELRLAADTIWELRNKLCDMTEERDGLREENAKLRVNVTFLEMGNRRLKACYDNLSRQHTDLESKNAKLRELVMDI